MASPSGAIVLGGNFVGLGVAHSLGTQRVPVWVVDTDRSKSIAQFSRYTKRFIVSDEPVAELLLREGRHHGLDGWVVFPVNDEYVEILSENRDALSAMYRLVVPPAAVTRLALDKRLTYSKAAELGIATPRTWTAHRSEEIADVVEYPAILKPAVNHHFFPHTNVKALPIDNAADLHARFSQMTRYIVPAEILVQERIPGGGENQLSFCAACKDGEVYASLVAQRRRQYPIDFGNASSFVETTRQPTVERDGRRFLESIGFDGMVEVEFKFDPRDGRYKILDVNPRPWGWHTLGRAAGVDFAYLTWRQKVGHPVSQVFAKRDAAWVREITDWLAVLKSPNPKTEIARLVKVVATGRFTPAVFDPLDPVPFFAEFVLWASNGLSRQKKARDVLANS